MTNHQVKFTPELFIQMKPELSDSSSFLSTQRWQIVVDGSINHWFRISEKMPRVELFWVSSGVFLGLS